MAGISIPLAKRAVDTLKICKFCLHLYLDPKNEQTLLGQQSSHTLRNLAFDNENHGGGDVFCTSCLGILSSDSIKNIAASITSFVNEHGLAKCDFSLSINSTPILDLSRILIRTVLTGTSEKTFPFPATNDLIGRLALMALDSSLLNISDESNATCKVIVNISVANQLLYCRGLWPEFKEVIGKRKRNGFDGSSIPPPSTDFSLSRSQSDGILAELKRMPKTKLDELEQRILSFRDSEDAKQIQVSWSISSERCPVYLFGRYKKLARDVPQSLWMVTSTVSDQNDCDEGDVKHDSSLDTYQLAETRPTHQRKGRNSVEEIVSFAVKQVSGCSECRLHACGREDIDVRCIGNGRPFALEIINSSISFGVDDIKIIEDSINSNTGLNSEEDIQVSHLSKTDRNCWEFMQKKAEEKKKGYCCVVWSERPVDRAALQAIENMAKNGHDRDEIGAPCLQIHQRTPLRVLHRRSLIDRVRYIYNIETALINSHFFLLRLVTSAGTYVKEFVHGDLGRTIPSIFSVLKCHTDILQLDVCQLYDDFIGGCTFVSNTTMSSIVESAVTLGKKSSYDNGDDGGGGDTMSWDSLRSVKLPSPRSTWQSSDPSKQYIHTE